MNYVDTYLSEVSRIADGIDRVAVSRLVDLVTSVRDRGGRVFFLGVGGSAGNASHAVNDFRKIAGIEAYAPSDNVSELTARVNDDGWASTYVEWLRGSRLSERDLVFVLSVGGGDASRNISPNIVAAVDFARKEGAKVAGIVGRDGGHTARVADACVIIPTVDPATVTAHAESFQAVLWHLLVTHPALRAAEMKWESVR